MLSTKVGKKSVGKMRSIRFLAVLLVLMIALILGTTTSPLWASGWDIEECEEDRRNPHGLVGIGTIVYDTVNPVNRRHRTLYHRDFCPFGFQ